MRPLTTTALRPITALLLFTFATTLTTQAQLIETLTVLVPPTTILVATTVTQYSPDTTVTVTPTDPPSPQYTSDPDLRTSVLNSTNYFRWEHNATFLSWNDSLATYATNWAAECIWAHSHGGPGENLARGYSDVTSAVDAWGNERDLYDFNRPTGFTEPTGHFTQLVWKGTQTVGCAARDCAGRNGFQGWYLVCEYWPQGNIVGLGNDVHVWFEANVQRQVNDGQAYDIASATAGAGGVGTSWASSVGLPTATARSGSNRDNNRQRFGMFEVIAGVVALLGVLGI